MRKVRLWAGLVAVVLAMAASRGAAAADDVVLLPTVMPVPSEQGAPAELRRPDPEQHPVLTRWARHLDFILSEAAQDLGLTIDVSRRPTLRPDDLDEQRLVERAKNTWVVSPRLIPQGSGFRLRLVAVAPGSNIALVANRDLEPRELEVRAMVMLRDLVQAGRGTPAELQPPEQLPPDERAIVHHARSQGRAVLALNGAAFGGYLGFAIQRASTNKNEKPDPRLTYPLIALGTGIGLGGSMIVADEWDVGLGDAWYLSAGAWWPGAAGLLLAQSYGVDADDQHLYAVAGAAGGITLATIALTQRGMGEGGAVLTHSGGAFGLLLGGIAQLTYEGPANVTDLTPTRGMGYGAGLGVLAAGALATQVRVAASRVLLVDLGASLGALTGAAAASPLLLVGDEATKGRNRAWLASVAGGTLVGGAIAWWLTRSSEPARSAYASPLAWTPFAGVIGESVTLKGRRQPALGAGVSAVW